MKGRVGWAVVRLTAARAERRHVSSRAPYTGAMRSVADDVRRAAREHVEALTPDERVALTARLAEDDLDLFCATQHLARDEARRLLARRRHAGRRPSCAMPEDAP